MPFYKFVPRDGKQGQINSGKLSTHQPGVKRITRDKHEKKNTKNDTKKELAGLPGCHRAQFKWNCFRRNLWDPLAFNLPGFENCAMRFSWLKLARRWTGGNRSFLPDLSTLRSGKRPTQTLKIAKIRHFQLQKRQHTTFQVKIRLFWSYI